MDLNKENINAKCNLKLDDFDFDLPEELIAQEPAPKRTGSRLMALNRHEKTILHQKFTDLIGYLKNGDLLVFNDTKVIPARLFGHKEGTDGKVEVLLTNQAGENRWEALVKPGRRIQPGHNLIFGDGSLKGKVVGRTDQGTRVIEFDTDSFMEEIMKIGITPLPPYIRKPLNDPDRYQTVFAKFDGSSAAPTAALHFDDNFFELMKEKGVEWTFVTLHIGPGTFRPVKTDIITDHVMHSEYFKASPKNLEKIREAKKSGRRIIPVGTTAVRTLESIFDENLNITRTEGNTGIFIYPGYRFKMVDALVTNFHLPRSTLIMLVSALAGREFIMKAYNEAVDERYRFFSLGDCMFIH